GKLMGSTAYLPAARTLFVGSPRGQLHALDATTGTERWTHAVKARIVSSPAVSGDGRAVVFGAADGRIYALRPEDGQEIWSTPVGGQVSGSPALVGRRIYVTSKKGSLWALQTRDGAAGEDDPESARVARARLVERIRESGW